MSCFRWAADRVRLATSDNAVKKAVIFEGSRQGSRREGTVRTPTTPVPCKQDVALAIKGRGEGGGWQSAISYPAFSLDPPLRPQINQLEMAARAVELIGGNPFLGGANRASLYSRCPSSSPSYVRLKPSRRGRIEAVLRAAPCLPSVFLDPFLIARAAYHVNRAEEEEEEEEEAPRQAVTHEKLDRWMRQSIGEQIVRNIGEAPSLLRIFSADDNDDGGRNGSSSSSRACMSSSAVRVEREVAASAESWPHVKRRWEQGNSVPDGLVLIEELKKDGYQEEEEDEQSGAQEARSTSISVPCGDGDGDGDRTWGLMVQGRGLDCAACYILNTCRVRSSLGFCTHFCLVRAQCVGESVDTQLRKAWLLQGR